jgi:hypothetical protein
MPGLGPSLPRWSQGIIVAARVAIQARVSGRGATAVLVSELISKLTEYMSTTGNFVVEAADSQLHIHHPDGTTVLQVQDARKEEVEAAMEEGVVEPESESSPSTP